MRTIQRRVFVSGRVQGVSFRASTVEEAAKHDGIRGFVRNLEDGRVEALFNGPEDAVLRMVAWCKHGPRTARVSELRVVEETPETTLPPFAISRD
jgi:acylphosphatase